MMTFFLSFAEKSVSLHREKKSKKVTNKENEKVSLLIISADGFAGWQ